LKIAVNTRLLLHNKLEGIGWFTYEIFKRMAENHPEHTFYFLFDRAYHPSFVFSKNVIPIVVSPQARHPLLYKIWFDISLKRVFKKIKPDVFISPDGYLSLTTDVPQINVIHDLNFEHYPNAMPAPSLKYYKKYFPLFAKKAKHIVTVSEYSKQDIVTTYTIDAEKISVVYNAPSDAYFPLSDDEQQHVRNTYTQGAPYFVYVGSINPRKNPVKLLQAFDAFKTKTGHTIKLVIVGNKMWKYKAFDDAFNAMKHQKDVVFTGHIQRKELNDIVSSARALVFLSFFEGFGIPLVEAMKAKTAILTTNLTAMPEVCADAALYCSSFDIEDMVEKMHQLSVNDNLVNTLEQKGLERVKHFNWDVSAQKFWNIIEQQINA
jgi:glycosyltransferase involved in cell wall biosynthesis